MAEPVSAALGRSVEPVHLIIVGTVHLDPDGFTALTTAMNKFAPDLVTVDVSNYAVEFRRSRSAGFLRRLDAFRRPDGKLPPALTAVEAQLAVPFEVRAAETWGGKFMLIGSDDDSRQRLSLLANELMAPENLTFLAGESSPCLQTQILRQWEKARSEYLRPGAIEPCDSRIADILRHLVAGTGGILLHVTGWQHLEPLAALLKDLSPELYLLSCLKNDSQKP